MNPQKIVDKCTHSFQSLVEVFKKDEVAITIVTRIHMPNGNIGFSICTNDNISEVIEGLAEAMRGNVHMSEKPYPITNAQVIDMDKPLDS